MKRLFFVGMAAALLSGAAFSADSEAELKVDLRDVVASGVVEPVDGMSTAGQPDRAALKVFADSGYTTVIDLRAAAENRGLNEGAVVEELGMSYVTLPITGAGAINFENAAKLDALIDASSGPVLVHCGSSNRVGALLALGKSLEGAEDNAALAFGKEAGMTSLEGRVEEVLGGE